MKELFNKISNAVSANSDAITQIDWLDVVSCIKTRAEMTGSLYTEEGYKSLVLRLDNICSALIQAADEFDSGLIIYHMNELSCILDAMPDMDIADEYIFNREYIRHRKENTIVVMGDSHVNFFSGSELMSSTPMGCEINLCKSVNNLPFSALHLGPALAYNINRQNTSTHFNEKAEYMLNSFIQKGSKIIISLGEVDLRVHVLSQASKQGRSFQAVIDDILNEYITYLIRLKNMGYEVYSWEPIGTQVDATMQDPQFPRTGSETECNMATRYFNDTLSKLCEKNNIGFMTVFYDMVTEDNHTITDFLSSDMFHLGQHAMTIAMPMFKQFGLF